MYNYSVNVIKRSDKAMDGTSGVMLDLRVNGRRKRLSLSVRVQGDEWDERRKMVKQGKPLARQRNTLISKAVNDARRIFYDSEIRGEPLVMRSFLELYQGTRVEGNFVEFVDEEIRRMEVEISAQTVKNYRKFYHRLKGWRDVIAFHEINEEFVEQWHRYMLGFGNSVNTLKHYHKLFKMFVRLAMRRKLLDVDPYRDFHYQGQKTLPTYLNDEEVQLLIDEYNGAPSCPRRRTLRHFLFMCFTGLRYSDLARLSGDHLHGRELVFSPQKTKKSLGNIVVPLNDFAMRLIMDEKKQREVPDYRLFVPVSNQKMNDLLKVICTDVGIRKRVSCHVARHTFATLFLAAGNNIEVLQKLLGHSELKTTMMYRSVMKREKVEGLNRMDEFFIFN